MLRRSAYLGSATRLRQEAHGAWDHAGVGPAALHFLRHGPFAHGRQRAGARWRRERDGNASPPKTGSPAPRWLGAMRISWPRAKRRFCGLRSASGQDYPKPHRALSECRAGSAREAERSVATFRAVALASEPRDSRDLELSCSHRSALVAIGSSRPSTDFGPQPRPAGHMVCDAVKTVSTHSSAPGRKSPPGAVRPSGGGGTGPSPTGRTGR